MDYEEKLIKAMISMEILENRLEELSNLISTLQLGLMKERVEKQALDCIQCLFYSVSGLHMLAEEMLSEIKE